MKMSTSMRMKMAITTWSINLVSYNVKRCHPFYVQEAYRTENRSLFGLRIEERMPTSSPCGSSQMNL